ncbi:MAG: EamA family transporter [Anaerolineae bacterium]|nr:EamA family transporter [Anaerolineae bacterium]
MERGGAQVWLALGGVLLFWSSAFVGIRIGLRTFTPGHLVLLRFVVASIVLAVYALLTRMPFPDRRDLPALAMVGFTGIALYQVLLTYGQTTVDAGTASFLVATGPIFTALFAVAFAGERLKPWGWAGVITGFAGGVLIALSEGRGLRISMGAMLILGAAVATAVFSVVQKRLLEKYTALQVMAFAMWTGTALMLVFSPGLLSAVRSAPLKATLVVVYLGVFPAALGYVLWSYLHSKIPVSVCGSFLYLIAPIAAVMGWIALDETPALISLLGGGVSVAGVVILSRLGRS